jgi:hypothetical protein
MYRLQKTDNSQKGTQTHSERAKRQELYTLLGMLPSGSSPAVDGAERHTLSEHYRDPGSVINQPMKTLHGVTDTAET